MQTNQDETETLWDGLDGAARSAIMEAGLAAREIVEYSERRRWLKVGAGLAAVRAEALRLADTNNIQHPVYRRFHALILTKVPDLAQLDERDHASCQHALWMFNNWDAVESFLAGLDIALNNRLNHPTSIKRRFEASSKRKPQGLEKPPSVTARKDQRIAELEQEVRELQVSGPVEEEEEFQPRNKTDRRALSLLQRAEQGWKTYQGAAVGSRAEELALLQARTASTELATLLLERHGATVDAIIEDVCIVSKLDFSDFAMLDDIENTIEERAEEDGWSEDQRDFVKFKSDILTLGCLMFLAQHTLLSLEQQPDEPDSEQVFETMQRGNGMALCVEIIERWFDRTYALLAPRLLRVEVVVSVLETLAEGESLAPELKERLRRLLD